MSASSSGRVVHTVRGPIDQASLGVTLAHEHLWMDSTPLLATHGYQATDAGDWDSAVAADARWNPGSHPDNYRLTDVGAAVEELAPFVRAGGRSILELTPPSLGRDPFRVREIAERSGVHVVLGAGQYLEPVHEPWVAAATDAETTRRLLVELDEGTDGSGIRPGISGEIGTSDPVRPGEVRVLRAVAAASVASGLAISVHLHPWGHEDPAVLDLLVAAGATPERVILGHLTPRSTARMACAHCRTAARPSASTSSGSRSGRRRTSRSCAWRRTGSSSPIPWGRPARRGSDWSRSPSSAPGSGCRSSRS